MTNADEVVEKVVRFCFSEGWRLHKEDEPFTDAMVDEQVKRLSGVLVPQKETALTPELLKKAFACEMCGSDKCGNMYRDKQFCSNPKPLEEKERV